MAASAANFFEKKLAADAANFAKVKPFGTGYLRGVYLKCNLANTRNIRGMKVGARGRGMRKEEFSAAMLFPGPGGWRMHTDAMSRNNGPGV